MSLHATNGAKIYIGGAITVGSTDLTATNFEGQSWVQIGEPESIGSYGDTATEITFDSLSSSRTRRLKGTRSGGNMELVFGLVPTDLGQVALIAAEKSPADFAFKIEFPDAPTGGTPTTRMFAAKVGQAVEQLDAANNVMKLNSQLWLNSNVVRVAAAPAPEPEGS